MISLIYTLGFVVALVCIVIYMKETDQDGRVTAQDLIWCIIFAALWWIVVPMIMFWEFLKFIAKILSK